MDRVHLSHEFRLYRRVYRLPHRLVYFSLQITGDTVYNLMKIGELETDKEDRPVDPPQIVSVEVI